MWAAWMPWRRCCIPRALRASLEYSVFAASGEMGCWIRKRKSLISDSPSHVVDSVGHCVAVAKVDWIRYYSIDTTWTWIRFFCAVRMLAFFGGPLGRYQSRQTPSSCTLEFSMSHLSHLTQLEREAALSFLTFVPWVDSSYDHRS